MITMITFFSIDMIRINYLFLMILLNHILKTSSNKFVWHVLYIENSFCLQLLHLKH